jgi:hypothetical protein
MPNWCSNYVTFSGDKENLNKLNNALIAAEKAEKAERQGQKIHSLESVIDGYFFEIYFDASDDSITLQFETRWAPNIEDIAQLCLEYELTAEHEYEECGCQIYGTTTYDIDGTYIDEQVNQEFLDLIEYDDESGLYLYNDESWESEMELITTEYPKWKNNNL